MKVSKTETTATVTLSKREKNTLLKAIEIMEDICSLMHDYDANRISYLDKKSLKNAIDTASALSCVIDEGRIQKYH